MMHAEREPPGLMEVFMRHALRLTVYGAMIGAAAVCGPLVHAHQFPEVNVSPDDFGDTEYDSARDGIYCSTCNFGEGNSRFNWTDPLGHLWLGHINWETGALQPRNGKAEIVDSHAAFWSAFGNGPEWAFSQQGSQLVYTRYVPGMPRTPAYAGAAMATMVDGVWTAGFLPGAIAPTGTPGAGNTILPEASQGGLDPVALVLYLNLAIPPQMFTEQVVLTGASPNLTPFGSFANGISERWVPGTHQLLFLGYAPPDANGVVYQQVFWYDMDTNAVAQLTTDSTNKDNCFMFQAPEFNDTYVFYTVANNATIDVYEQTGFDNSGAPQFQLINQISSPDPLYPSITSTEPFINCTPACRTYIFMALPAVENKNPSMVPSGLAVTNIDPANPFFEELTNSSSPVRRRVDPEYFITAKGPFLYYNRVIPATSTTPAKSEGEFFIDMLLGAPSGPCVGSSAEGGMLPGC